MRAFVTLALLALAAAPLAAQTEPTVFICGIWPDRILFFDQTTDTFTEGLHLRHGAVTRSSHTPDKRKFFAVTGRMETVEVIDPVRREVVDEFTLSTGAERIRIFGVFPNHDGTKAYLTVTAVKLEIDRFVRSEDVDIIAYDLEKREVTERFTLPEEVTGGNRPAIHFAPDGKSFYIIAKDVHRLDAETHEVLETLPLSRPLLAGYGPFRGVNLTETEPG
ncbi:MAG TPA: hypothetical protein VEK15_05255, partial [Vicinamibacteria bacterium]|nr:hypothetical protein [Vicinamibacteria bacterium]